MTNKLEDLIRSRVHLGAPSNTGFHSLRCPICNDYKTRGGFKFDHETVGYNCFNCGFDTRVDQTTTSLPKKFRKLMLALNIAEDELEAVTGEMFLQLRKNSSREHSIASLKQLKLTTPEVPLPEEAVPLTSLLTNNELRLTTEAYLLKRGFKVSDHPWYVCPTGKFSNRLVIPFLRQGKIIYWQARDITGLKKERYLSSPAPKAPVLFGYDELYNWTDAPLFVTEGALDALTIFGVGLLGSTLSEEQLELLRHTKRRLIFVIDKNKNGKNLGELALREGWEITFPPGDTADAADSRVKHGKLYTVYHLLQEACRGPLALSKLRIYCSKKKK